MSYTCIHLLVHYHIGTSLFSRKKGIQKPNPDLVPNSGPIPDHFWHFGPDLDQVRNSGPFWSLWQIIKGVIACDDSPAAMFQIDSMTSKTFKLGPKCKIMQIKTHRSFLHYASLSNLEVAWIGPALHLACFWDQGLHLWSRLAPPGELDCYCQQCSATHL